MRVRNAIVTYIREGRERQRRSNADTQKTNSCVFGLQFSGITGHGFEHDILTFQL